MTKRSKSIKPSQFTESVQFIQSLFQEPESRWSKVQRLLLRVIFWIGMLFVVAIFAATIGLFWVFEVEATQLSQDGLFIPKR